MKIFVGNLPYNYKKEHQVKDLFKKYGEVRKVELVKDRITGRPRGFGFVEMSETDGRKAIKALDLKDVEGRGLKVNKVEPDQAVRELLKRRRYKIGRMAGLSSLGFKRRRYKVDREASLSSLGAKHP